MVVFFAWLSCKANYAFYVNFITPCAYSAEMDFTFIMPIINPFLSNYLWFLLLDSRLLFGIIRLTVKISYSGDRYHGRLWRCKTGSTCSKRHIKHSSGQNHRRVVPGRRILRPARHVASQIRDASTGQTGRNEHFASSRNIWLLPRFILSDTTCLRTPRLSRSYAASARPQVCPQINQRGDDLYRVLPKGNSGYWGNRVSFSVKAAFWSKCTSPQYRTGIAASAKKRALKLPESEKHFIFCVKRYEQLRRMILDGKDYCGRGWGLALIVHRGFMAWATAFSKIDSCQQQSESFSSVANQTPPSLPDTIQGKIITAISDMVLSTLQGVAL